MVAGRQAVALTAYDAASTEYQRLGDARSVTEMLSNVGAMLCDLGALELAEERLKVALHNSEKIDLRNVAGCIHVNLALVRAHLGRYPEATDSARKALALGQEQHDLRMVGVAQIYLAIIGFRQQDHVAATEHAREAIVALWGVPPLLPVAVAMLARSLLAQKETDEALIHARQANLLADQVGQVEDCEALIPLVLVECLSAAGDVDEARSAVAKASTRLTERAASVGDPEWRSAFLSRIPDHKTTLDLATAFRSPNPLPG